MARIKAWFALAADSCPGQGGLDPRNVSDMLARLASGPIASLISVAETQTGLSDTPDPPVHQPVLLAEVIDALAVAPGQTIVDGTLGAGGHAGALSRLVGPSGRVIGLDRDPAMIELARNAQETSGIEAIHASYDQMRDILNSLDIEGVDRVLLDLGLSSDQLAWSERGFSFQSEGPLDMRFDPASRTTASALLRKLSETELADLFFKYGEERHSRRIARAIVTRRKWKPLETTTELAELVRRNSPGKWRRIDPATRVFQALRIAVNDELGRLEAFLAQAGDLLNPDGRVAVISFHSIEDRMVKHAFRSDPRLEPIGKKPITASEGELALNPRSRSAKLRAAVRVSDASKAEKSHE